ncbi:MgtC/SapB family protein [Streptomyces sp. NPDC051662]|uniref:MgtC/SapB family protein n=1 Tax=Streptomyces sp. NPDC051662 TaxID=3154750 RepID=UPI00343C5D43
MRSLTAIEFLIRLATGVGCGALIGVERQWRARMAGLRTNTLVATGATLFVLYGVAVDNTGSSTRVASYVVSGIGFLGGGVILRHGARVRGLNTAATLWCSAAVGVMAACGLPHDEAARATGGAGHQQCACHRRGERRHRSGTGARHHPAVPGTRPSRPSSGPERPDLSTRT